MFIEFSVAKALYGLLMLQLGLQILTLVIVLWSRRPAPAASPPMPVAAKTRRPRGTGSRALAVEDPALPLSP